jgi:putative membrane protein
MAMKKLDAAGVVVLSLLLAGSALARSANNGGVSYRVLEDIHKADLAEIKVAEFAATRVTDPDVRTFAGWLVRENKASEIAIAEAAGRAGVTLTDRMPPMADETIRRMSQRTGYESDREFLRDMAADHQQALESMAADRRRVENKEVLALVDQIAPTVQKHKTAAEALLRRLTASEAPKDP